MFRRSLTLLSACFSALVLLLAFAPAARAQQSGDVMIVLPFENTTNQREYNWIGTSFADSLTDLLQMYGLRTVSTDERELIYQRLRLPLTATPSRATAINVAMKAKATLAVIGTYDVVPAKDDKTPTEVRVSVRVVRVNEGQIWPPYIFGDALVNLQKMQGILAYQILHQRDSTLAYSRNEIVERATKIPPRAFESYVKGVMTDDREKRSNYLQNALKEYAKANAGASYPQAAFELGTLYFKQEDWKRAAENFTRLQKGDPHFAEASFYAALSYWRMNDIKTALGALLPVATDMPLTGIYNNAGALSIQAAQVEKSAEERERLLKQAQTFLERAKESDPEDASVIYNYAYTLFLAGRHADAAEQLRSVIMLNPRDGEARFLYAKALEKSGATAEMATAADNEARRYLPTYAKVQTAWQKSGVIPAEVPARLNQQFDIAEAVKAQAPLPVADTASVTTQDLLVKARADYTAGRDDDVLSELNRVLMIEPMNAEAHLLIGRIYQRRGDLVRAISSLKTAIFWEAKLIDAHILLGRIFLERGDLSQAKTHARTAIGLDPNNQEAIALYRQLETGAR
ncbi:MAG TPA: CDC27 family protein [Pyrinomonadaceae bacterium]|nr:CDC27 family protein [Pyrinomonadaceae bacterium]